MAEPVFTIRRTDALIEEESIRAGDLIDAVEKRTVAEKDGIITSEIERPEISRREKYHLWCETFGRCLCLPCCQEKREVKQYENALIFRFGRLLLNEKNGKGLHGPGEVHHHKHIDFSHNKEQGKITVASLRKDSLMLQDQYIITSDEKLILISPILFYSMNDPMKFYLNLKTYTDPMSPIKLLLASFLRDVTGNYTYEQIVVYKDNLLHDLQSLLYEIAIHWGIVIDNIEFSDIKMVCDIKINKLRNIQVEKPRSSISGTQPLPLSLIAGVTYTPVLAITEEPNEN